MKKLKLVKPVCKREGCEFFNEQHPRCRGHNKLGKACGTWPVKGMFVCRKHGGATDEAKINAERRIAMTEAAKLVAFDPNDDESAEAGLLREMRQASQTARAYGLAVASLEQGGALTQPTPGGEKLHVLIEAWTAERMRHGQLAKYVIEAGIATRQVELAEYQAAAIVGLLTSVIMSPRLGLSTEQVIEAKIVAAEALRALDS